MLVRAKNIPRITTTLEAMVVWLGDTPMNFETRYLVRHTTREVKGFVNLVEYRIDVHNLGRAEAGPLSANEIGRVSLTTTAPLFIDSYQRNRATGNFILVDPNTLQTVSAGMVIERGSYGEARIECNSEQPQAALHREEPLVSRAEREIKLGHKAVTFWMTGLSGSGKSTIAKKTERALFDRGVQVFLLDGDNLRRGLNRELGFSQRDRSENLRRAAEVAALLNQAGVSALCAFISPYESDRIQAREIIGADRFLEVFISAPLETCEQRDPHGLYQKARSGEIMNFTGISDPYEPPTAPELVLDTTSTTEDECVERLVAFWVEKATRGPRRS
jgi:bifunctional enzyme CysN/CysC